MYFELITLLYNFTHSITFNLPCKNEMLFISELPKEFLINFLSKVSN